MNRIKFLSKITYTVSISLAMAFVFSCSSDNKDDNKNDNNNKSGYCLEYYWVGSDGGYCRKTIDGSCADFSYICPSGYDRSPKACLIGGISCRIIIPKPVVGSSGILESDCINQGNTVVDYNTTCVR